jgi:hypothetical protein
VGGLLAGARQVEGIHTQRDWSYGSRHLSSPGFLLAGDAACFIDPILSSGMHLAMAGGDNAALAVHSALAEPAHEPAFMRYFQRSYAATYRDLLTQVRHFYRVEACREAVLWKSKHILRVEPRLDGSLVFVFLTSGRAQHVTAEAPHDLSGQAHAAFSSRLGAGAVVYRPRAPSRVLANPARLVVTGADGALLALDQDGLRLRPTSDATFAARPARARRDARRGGRHGTGGHPRERGDRPPGHGERRSRGARRVRWRGVGHRAARGPGKLRRSDARHRGVRRREHVD